MRRRRQKPSSVAGRKRAAELTKLIRNPRTSRADRDAALRELDAVAPYEDGTLSEIEAPTDEAPRKKEYFSPGTSVPPAAPSQSIIDEFCKMDSAALNKEFLRIVCRPPGWSEELHTRMYVLMWRQAVLGGFTTLDFQSYQADQEERRIKGAAKHEGWTLEQIAERYGLKL